MNHETYNRIFNEGARSLYIVVEGEVSEVAMRPGFESWAHCDLKNFAFGDDV